MADKFNSDPLRDQCPWLTFKAIAWLEDYVQPGMSVHEWGSGGSTVFYAKRCAQVVAVEHHKGWADRVTQRLHALGLNNAKVKLVDRDRNAKHGNHLNPRDYTSSGAGRMENYCKTIEGMHDLVIVDGRSRNGCMLEAVQHVKPGGWLILDNADRGRYKQGCAIPESLGWSMLDWTGSGSYSDGIVWSTRGWQCPG